MAGLAALLRDRGLRVSGCDLAPGTRAAWLGEREVAVAAGHDPAHVDASVTAVVRSTAVPEAHPELAAARAAGVPVLRRGDVLAALLRDRRSVVVAGTHGKTTTTAFAVQLLRQAGVACDWFVGWEVPGLEGLASGRAGGLCVAEGDESDGTLAAYAPTLAVLTNVEFDHMEHFRDAEAFRACFRRFLDAAGEGIVYCADDPGAAALCAGRNNVWSYGLAEGARLRAVDLCVRDAGTTFDVLCDGAAMGRCTLPVRGEHNVRNALAALAVARHVGVADDVACAGVATLRLPRRRLECVAQADRVTVLSDYAHHPGEIRALLQAVPACAHARRCAIFQPHRYTRTRALGDELAASFAGLDALILLPVYAASETPLRDGDVWALYRRVRARGDVPVVTVADTRAEAWAGLRDGLGEGDTVLLVGAGDVAALAANAADDAASADGLGPRRIDRLAADLQARLPAGERVRARVPLAPRTTLKVGGPADLYAEAESEAGLAAMLAWCCAQDIPMHVLGVGSNTLVSDLGVRGLVVRLGRDFRAVRVQGTRVTVGGGCSNRALLSAAARADLGGMAFLEGIPGTIGGAVRMNAGAYGGETGPHVRRVRCLDRDGREQVYTQEALTFRYRRCEQVVDRIVVEVELDMTPTPAADVQAARRDIAGRRAWWKDLRSAGSIFKNPPSDFAGALVERAGLRGTRVGGACIYETHGNVIATEPGACAADVRALITLARERVHDQFGVELESEILYLGGA